MYGYFRFPGKAQVLVSRLQKVSLLDLEKLPSPQDNNEAALQQMIHELNRMRMEAEEARDDLLQRDGGLLYHVALSQQQTTDCRPQAASWRTASGK